MVSDTGHFFSSPQFAACLTPSQTEMKAERGEAGHRRAVGSKVELPQFSLDTKLSYH